MEMVKHKKKEYKLGMNYILEEAKKSSRFHLDFGILKLEEGSLWEDKTEKERALLLIKGSVELSWEGKTKLISRESCFTQGPQALQLPAGMPVKVRGGQGGAELCYEACLNEKDFPARYYGQKDIREDVFGAGTLGETSIRTVRTIFDGKNADFSNMVLGEVINHPGKWSSYPPHDHPHPEIYHYRMHPPQGFGVSLLEDQAFIVKDDSTSLIPGHLTHAQAAAPGYAMYYIWMIPHLPGDRWLPSTRFFRKEHQWLMEKNPKIWPEWTIGEEK